MCVCVCVCVCMRVHFLTLAVFWRQVSESSERSQNENGVPLIDFETPKPATILDTATDDTAVDSTDGGSLPADGQSSWVAEWPDMVNVSIELTLVVDPDMHV